MAINIAGGVSSTNKANVSANYELEVVTPRVVGQAGFVHLSTESDPGTVTGSRTIITPESSDDYRLRVAIDQVLFNLAFAGTTQRTDLFNTVVSTMTVAQASGYLTLNSGNAVAVNNAAQVTTRRTFPLFGTYPTYCSFWIRDVNSSITNAISEWGFGFVSGTAAPTDGVFFRRNAGGELKAVISNNGVETEATITTTNIPARDSGSFNPANCNHYCVVFHNDIARFWINDTLVANIKCPGTNPSLASASAQPMFARVYNTGSTASARRVEIGWMTASTGDQSNAKPMAYIIAGFGGNSCNIQEGSASGPTTTRASGSAGWPASGTARIAGTWTATTAPATASLGGLWTTPAISTLTSDADYPVFAYQNPTGTASLPGKTLYITGIRVGEAYASVAASTNPIFLSCFVSGGGTAAATNTTDAATTISHRVVAIGGHGFTATDVAGTTRPGFEINFATPLVVPPGTFFVFIVRPFGTVTSNTLVVTSSLAVNGYFE